MDRSLKKQLLKDISEKIVILSGPRQVGKTTLAQSLSIDHEYLTYDFPADRLKLAKYNWNHNTDLLVLDELHKMKKWKLYLKGLYDKQKASGLKQKIIVTGSARLDTFKKVGDSLAGRYFQFHLFPLDLKELSQKDGTPTESDFEKLLTLSGFPEPYFKNSIKSYNRWQKTHLDIILRQDLIETESLKRISDIETLIELMRERAGSPLSYTSIKEDLRTDDKTVKRWMNVLENAFIFFKIMPYSERIKDAIHKMPKYYFFDVPRVFDPGARFENHVALSLLKEIYYRNEVNGENYSLHYLKNKQHQEIDFLVCQNKKPVLALECKLSNTQVSKNFKYFDTYLPKEIKKIQLIKNLTKDFTTIDGVQLKNALSWLSKMIF